MTLPSARDTLLQWKTFFSFLEIFWCAQDFYFLSRRKAWQGRRLQCRRTRKTKRKEQHTVSVGLTTRSKWFPFRVFTEIFILDIVQSSAATAMARPRRNKKKQDPFPPTSFFFLVLACLWLPCTAHSPPPPPPRHSYPLSLAVPLPLLLLCHLGGRASYLLEKGKTDDKKLPPCNLGGRTVFYPIPKT